MAHPKFFSSLLVLLAASLLAGLANPARAEAISYSLTFCENLDVLKDPTNDVLRANVSKQTQHSLLMARTNPFFELRNTSEHALLTQFTLSIGDLTKNFDWAKAIETSGNVSFTIDSVDSVMGGSNSDLLTISFSNFTPGDYVRFRFGIAADDPNTGIIHDYRTVLFDLNGGNDLTGNAEAKVTFESGNSVETLTNQLPNFSMGGLTTATDMSFPSGPCFDHVLPFTLTGDGTIDPDPGPPVPEPGSIVMLGIGLGALCLGYLRHRQGR